MSRTQRVADHMREQIQTGAWPLNSRIPTESELAVLLGVGRSTVREATRSMVDTGMLEAAPGRGTFVRARSAVNGVLSSYLLRQPLPDLLGLRRALDAEVAALAADNRTDADLHRLRRSLEEGRHRPEEELPASVDPAPTPGSFHADLLAAAGNPLLTELHQCTIVAVRRAVVHGLLRPGPLDERVADHQLIYDAVAGGDAEAARAAAAAHSDRDFTVATTSDGVPGPASRSGRGRPAIR